MGNDWIAIWTRLGVLSMNSDLFFVKACYLASHSHSRILNPPSHNHHIRRIAHSFPLYNQPHNTWRQIHHWYRPALGNSFVRSSDQLYTPDTKTRCHMWWSHGEPWCNRLSIHCIEPLCGRFYIDRWILICHWHTWNGMMPQSGLLRESISILTIELPFYLPIF